MEQSINGNNNSQLKENADLGSEGNCDASSSENGINGTTERISLEKSVNEHLNKKTITDANEQCAQRTSNECSRGGNVDIKNHDGSGLEGIWHIQNEQNQSVTPANVSSGAQMELWVETKADDGKSYFYHALTRETTWNKPEGPNVKVITQTEIEEINRTQQTQQEIPIVPIANMTEMQGKTVTDAISTKTEFNPSKMVLISNTDALAQLPPNMLTNPPPTAQQPLSQPPPNMIATATRITQQPPPALHQPPPFFSSGIHPSANFSQSPFGMPPPGYSNFPGGPTTWNIPWNQHMLTGKAATQDKPAKSLIIKPGVIDPVVISRAAEWSEHRAPDGRPYYYHASSNESVWEKPQALRDIEAARMAAHSGATPQSTAVPLTTAPVVQHMMPNTIMHMTPTTPAGLDTTLAYNTAAAAIAKASELAKTTAVEKEIAGSKKGLEEIRRKEEEQKKSATTTVISKPIDKTRPISSTPISGTPWCVVWTGDARVFFYNPSTRTSVWERPEELLEREDVDKAVSNTPAQLKNLPPNAVAVIDAKKKANCTEHKFTNIVHEENPREEDEVIKIHTESESSVEEIPTKKFRISNKSSKKADASEAAAEAEVRAAKERAVVPLETRVKQFKDMLREKDVSAFSTWEKELHKIVFDPRYLLLTSKERKQVFEKYVKDRAEEERKEKRNKMRQKRDDFRKLMEDAKLHGKSSFSDFFQRYGKDERYKAVEKIRERESLFNEYIIDVRRQEKEEKLQKKEQVRRDFIEMLRERSDVDRHTRWYDIKKKFEADSRYRAVENSLYREEYFQDYMRLLKDEKRKQREQKDRDRDRERERERDRKLGRKSDRKDKQRDRDRSRSKEKDINDKDKVLKDKHEYENNKGGGHNNSNDKNAEEGEHHEDEEIQQSNNEIDDSERLQKERERQIRAEQSIREREKEVQRTLAGHLRDRDKEREHHKRDEAIGHFNAVLTDLVRNPDLSWKEVKRQLRKDHRWELIESLDRDNREKIFNEHIDALMRKKREKFREILNEVSTLELTSSWKDIKKLIKDDPRFLKYNNSDKCEREYRDYIKDKTLNAKNALRELLHECKLITHKSIELVKDNPNHLKEIQDILKNDKRYLVLEHLSEERTAIVVNYLDELNKRGPPPPPTASESTRRNK